MSGPETRREGILRKHFQMLTMFCLAIMSGVVIFGAVAGYLHYSGMFEPTLADVPFEAVLGKHKTSVIVTFALSEGAAFLVIVMGLLSGEMTLGLGIAALAVVAMAILWPKKTDLEETLRRIQY